MGQEYAARTVWCPVCTRGKLMGAAKHTAPSGIRTHPPPGGEGDYFVKCPKCKRQIGISIHGVSKKYRITEYT